ncbi:branched-chain amino acid aminotransferase [Solimonas aquatica]|uniref:Branched-chain-amino-acid aminotransferase n=1 Tax=Solimonas aquatica TaxID=489703 RepID=A0A1H9L7Y1_9GAMM|nr:branched-chain-amino-acid transaminase [Solimonas aquatica]SER07534.1 branched-chain amino acid aminotransferase [Solimonas aquatica]
MQTPPSGLLEAPLPADYPQPEALVFGQILGPYLVHAHHDGEHWHTPQLSPRAEAPLPMASGGLQYGFSVFEGLKAYRDPQQQIQLFRPRDHARRLANSAQRLAMPVPDEELFLQLCQRAVQVHARYVPPHGRGALYLRPTLFAEEEGLGFRVARRHGLSVAVTPCCDPPQKTIRLWAETELVRAAPGGMGEAKTGGNYAAGILGLQRARARGYDDVVWLDARQHRQLGEAGTMNIFVQIGHELITPPLDGTILPGITRDSLIRLLRAEGMSVLEHDLSLDELVAAQMAGQLGTAFGVGTAARLVQISEIAEAGRSIGFSDTGLAARAYTALKQVQEGSSHALREWRVAVPTA